MKRTSTPRASVKDTNFGDRHDELAAPLADVRHLLDDLVRQVPRQDQHVVRASLADALWMVDRHARPRKELALLVRASVHGEVDEVCSDAAVVEKGVAFPRGAVPSDRLPAILRVDKKFQELSLRLFHALTEAGVRVQTRHPGIDLPPPKLLRAIGRRMRGVVGMAGVDPQRAAVRRDLVDIEDRQMVRREDPLGRNEREVREVLVVDGVELVLAHELKKVRELDRDDAAWLEDDAQPLDKIIEIWNLSENVRAADEVGLSPCRAQLESRFLAEELDECRYPLRHSHPRNVGRGLDAQYRDPHRDEVLEQIAVIARDLDDEAASLEAKAADSHRRIAAHVLDPAV